MEVVEDQIRQDFGWHGASLEPALEQDRRRLQWLRLIRHALDRVIDVLV
ncbi:MAG TPA: hypothetical protein VGS16_13675 [Candidatus Dormibacteraeota bacterium]|nr:hypothetical protein [Candidatus Dormibacteraeota bacterium]